MIEIQYKVTELLENEFVVAMLEDIENDEDKELIRILTNKEKVFK